MNVTFRVCGCLVVLAIAVVGMDGAAAGSAATSICPGYAKGWQGHVTGVKIRPSHPATEARVIVLINRVRRAHGLHTLALSSGLRYAARFHDAAVQSNRPSAVRYTRYSPSKCIAKDVALASGKSGRAARTVSRWLASPARRHILLLPWIRLVGVGVRTRGDTTVTTAVFSAAIPTAKPRKPASPKPVPTAPAPPSGPVVGVPYTCDGPVNGVVVRGTGSSTRALVNLAAGCTGTLSFDITVDSGGGDGVKVQPGAHDLTIGPSRVVCQPLDDTSFHQDGVQVQGGSNVTFNDLTVICPYVTGQGAAAFYIDGKDFPGISNVICNGCDLEHLHYGALFTAPAPGSGVENSIIHQGALTHGYYQIDGDGAVDINNTLAPPCDGADVPC